MRASMRADGTTFHLRHTSDPAGTEDPDGGEELGGVPHRDLVGVETTTDPATRGYEFLNDIAEQGKRRKHVH